MVSVESWNGVRQEHFDIGWIRENLFSTKDVVSGWCVLEPS